MLRRSVAARGPRIRAGRGVDVKSAAAGSLGTLSAAERLSDLATGSRPWCVDARGALRGIAINVFHRVTKRWSAWMTEQICIRLDDGLRAALAAEAARQQRTISNLSRIVLQSWIAERQAASASRRQPQEAA
jgi:hypothetical protein